jgi:hypothetical protein
MEYAWLEALTISGIVFGVFYLVYALYYSEYKDFFE